MDPRLQTQPDSPAADAAGLLLRIGFGLLVMLAPVAALFSRRAFVVLVPIGALLILIAALLRDGPAVFRRMREALVTPIGLAATGLAVWCLVSLAWTPFPVPAFERFLRTIGIGALALGVVCALPARMRATNLHLMTLGVAAATLALIVAAVLGPAALKFLRDPEAPTFGRAAAAAGVMVWPAVAWTLTRGRDGQAFSLIAVSGLAIAASGSIEAALVMAAALGVFLAGRTRPEAVGRILAVAAAAIVLAAPAVAFGAKALARVFRLARDSDLTELGYWADAIASQPFRLVTGHGFDTALRARLAGIVHPSAPGGLVPDVWYDFGILGAIALAAVAALTLVAASRLAQPVAATAMAAAVAALGFAVADPSAMQAWWLNVAAIAALMMAAVNNGQYRTSRPAASIGTGQPKRPLARIEGRK
jgi:hypothetical protein